jgi:hypothetical protein
MGTGVHTREHPTGQILLPHWMVAAAIDRFGGSEVLNLYNLHVPRPSHVIIGV